MKNVQFFLLFFILLATGCVENTGQKAEEQRAANSGTGLTTAPSPGAGYVAPTPTTGYNLEMINARIISNASSGGSSGNSGGASGGTGGTGNSGDTGSSNNSSTSAPPTIQIYFRTDLANGSTVDTLCGTNGSSGSGNSNGFPCLCRFSWTDINSQTGVGLSRTVDTPFNSIASFSASCAAPAVWDSEIPDGKQIYLTIRPDTTRGNTATIRTNQLIIRKSASTTNTGDFRDDEGRAIKNIFHYTCHDMFSKPLSIEHLVKPGKPRPGPSPSFPPPPVPIANRFTVNNTGYSAQAYWYDLYIPTDDPGQFNMENQGLKCPLVQVSKNGVLRNQPYPLDSTFALALQKSRNYVVPVVASTTLDLAGSGATTGTLGYAAKPNPDGTCPSYSVNGIINRTFRLRKYVVNYPLRYDATGRLVSNQTQPTNTVYILDRPVDKLGQDPLKPLTRLGPKPCPFSFANNRQFNLDSLLPDSARQQGPEYSCTVPSWKLPKDFFDSTDIRAHYGLPSGHNKGLSVDDASSISGGTEERMGNAATFCLPNGTDTGGIQYADSYASSSCALGKPCGQAGCPNSVNDEVSPRNIDGTAIRNNECPIYPPPAANLSVDGALHIKPLRGFVPDFLEDTTFQACAFQSSKPVDPDIVTVYNSYQKRAGDSATDDPKQARAFYCARVYPDPMWIQNSGAGAGLIKIPGNCDSGRPKYKDVANRKYYIPKSTGVSEAGATYSGYANLSYSPTAAPSRRTVPDGVVTSYAIMNERTYACAFTFNPTLKVPYSDRNRLTDLVTPRSGCCQRCAGSLKSGGCSRGGLDATAANRGIHSLVDPFVTADGGAFYNKYGLPAFTMQSALLSSAPMQLIPNRGKHNQSATIYSSSSHYITGNASSSNATYYGNIIVTGSKNGGNWTTDDDGTPLGCYDPSEDP